MKYISIFLKTSCTNNFETHINADTPVVVDFFAEWCGPCIMIPPILKNAKAVIGGQATILKMDVDKNWFS